MFIVFLLIGFGLILLILSVHDVIGPLYISVFNHFISLFFTIKYWVLWRVGYFQVCCFFFLTLFFLFFWALNHYLIFTGLSSLLFTSSLLWLIDCSDFSWGLSSYFCESLIFSVSLLCVNFNLAFIFAYLFLFFSFVFVFYFSAYIIYFIWLFILYLYYIYGVLVYSLKFIHINACLILFCILSLHGLLVTWVSGCSLFYDTLSLLLFFLFIIGGFYLAPSFFLPATVNLPFISPSLGCFVDYFIFSFLCFLPIFLLCFYSVLVFLSSNWCASDFSVLSFYGIYNVFYSFVPNCSYFFFGYYLYILNFFGVIFNCNSSWSLDLWSYSSFLDSITSEPYRFWLFYIFLFALFNFVIIVLSSLYSGSLISEAHVKVGVWANLPGVLLILIVLLGYHLYAIFNFYNLSFFINLFIILFFTVLCFCFYVKFDINSTIFISFWIGIFSDLKNMYGLRVLHLLSHFCMLSFLYGTAFLIINGSGGFSSFVKLPYSTLVFIIPVFFVFLYLIFGVTFIFIGEFMISYLSGTLGNFIFSCSITLLSNPLIFYAGVYAVLPLNFLFWCDPCAPVFLCVSMALVFFVINGFLYLLYLLFFNYHTFLIFITNSYFFSNWLNFLSIYAILIDIVSFLLFVLYIEIFTFHCHTWNAAYWFFYNLCLPAGFAAVVIVPLLLFYHFNWNFYYISSGSWSYLSLRAYLANIVVSIFENCSYFFLIHYLIFVFFLDILFFYTYEDFSVNVAFWVFITIIFFTLNLFLVVIKLFLNIFGAHKG